MRLNRAAGSGLLWNIVDGTRAIRLKLRKPGARIQAVSWIISWSNSAWC